MANPKRLYVVDEATGCWLWSGSISSTGYGTQYIHRSSGRHTLLAHRWMYERKVGPIPEGLDIDHLCQTKRCVNPDHLEPVLPSVNCQRGPKAKLTTDEVADIRAAYAMGAATQVELGRHYGVHSATVSRIVRGERWPLSPTGRKAS